MSSGGFGSVFRRGLFAGKVALVTGGGTGIGRKICEEFLYLGGSVMMASRNAERLEVGYFLKRLDEGGWVETVIHQIC